MAARVSLLGESTLHGRLIADHARLVDEVQAAAQRHAQDIWIEKLHIGTREPARAFSLDLAGIDLAALLEAGMGAAQENVQDLADTLRAKSSGASLGLDSVDAAALVAEARALLLARAAGGEG